MSSGARKVRRSEEEDEEKRGQRKRSKRRMSRKREGTGGAGAIRAAMIDLCGSFGIVGLCKY